MSLLQQTAPNTHHHLEDGAGPIEDSLDLDSNDGFDDYDADEDIRSFDDEFDEEPSAHIEEMPDDEAPAYYDDAPVPSYYPNTSMCIVCQQKKAYNRNGKSYPTCGLTCAAKLEQALSQVTPSPGSIGRGHGGGYRQPLPVASSSTSAGTYPRSQAASTSPVDENPNIRHLAQHLGGNSSTPPRPRNPSYQSSPRGGHHQYQASASGSRVPQYSGNRNGYHTNRGGATTQTQTQTAPQRRAPVTTDPCVVCRTKPCYDKKYVTCGLKCAEMLCKGGGDPKMCDYCHRRPKVAGHNQCGDTCKTLARLACLLCKSRPKYKQYHLCGKTCKQISTKSTPLILEAPVGHATYDMVMKKFEAAWKYGTKPTIKKIYKIIESKTFLQPYDQYKKRVGNEVFRYHGTARKCTLGSGGNTRLCNDSTCALCCILKTSFKTSLANPSGAFGAGVYSSSAANKAYSYSASGAGAMLLTKVILGKPYPVNAFGVVSSCPAGYNSVVFDRNAGALNETIVYSDDAIRPVFLIMFA